MSHDSINLHVVRFLHVGCDFGLERRILLHISWGLMLYGFLKVMTCFRNLIYSFLYSATSLKKLALSKELLFSQQHFLLLVIVFENMPSYVVSWDRAGHTCEFRISEVSSVNPVEILKRFWRQSITNSTYRIAFLVSESTVRA